MCARVTRTDPHPSPRQSLESWSTAPEYRPFFRDKVWGGFGMLSQVVFHRERWMAAMMLDPETGLDTPGAKVRAAEGINAASSFMTGYWIWCGPLSRVYCVGRRTHARQGQDH